MTGVLIIPTGLGATIGGHAGDANPVAKLIAACCDKLILHPNVVNASDINEMPENSLYVEGSILDRFLMGEIELKEITQNKILVVANSPLTNDTVNAVKAAQVTIGIKAELVVLETPLKMVSEIKNKRATGKVLGWRELVEELKKYTFDALALHTSIEVDREVALNYFRTGGINPWGGVEAKASRLIATAIEKPVAHAPLENVSPTDEELYFIFKESIDARMAPEVISSCYLHSVLKGLNKAPRIGKGISVNDVDFLLSPNGCWGRPHIACTKRGIPVITVRENKVQNPCFTWKAGIGSVQNYWEAAGVIMSMKAGIDKYSVRS